MTTSRLYLVSDTADGDQYLVQAISQAQAVKHVAGSRYAVEAARPLDVAALMGAGQKVLDATKTVPDPTSGE